jgi:hypothetical protein
MSREWWKKSDLTPFAVRLRDYMLQEQVADGRPSLTVAELAKRVRVVDLDGKGVSEPTIWDWLWKGATPRRRALELLHRATGIARDELYELAGRPHEMLRAQQRGMAQSGQVEVARIGEEVWDFIFASISRRLETKRVSEHERQRIFDHLGEVRQEWRMHHDRPKP